MRGRLRGGRGAAGAGAASVSFRHSDTTRTRSYDVDAAFMLFRRHESGIHVVSAERVGRGGLDSAVTGMTRERRSTRGHGRAYCRPLGHARRTVRTRGKITRWVPGSAGPHHLSLLSRCRLPWITEARMRAVDIHDLEQEWAETTSGSIRGLCRTGKSPVLGGWRSIPVLVVTTADGAAYEFRGKVADWHAHLARRPGRARPRRARHGRRHHDQARPAGSGGLTGLA